MCSLLDYAVNKGLSEGLSLGRSEGMSEGVTQGIKALIETCRELGQSYNRTRKIVMDKYTLDENAATEKMNQYWGENEKGQRTT